MPMPRVSPRLLDEMSIDELGSAVRHLFTRSNPSSRPCITRPQRGFIPMSKLRIDHLITNHDFARAIGRMLKANDMSAPDEERLSDIDDEDDDDDLEDEDDEEELAS